MSESTPVVQTPNGVQMIPIDGDFCEMMNWALRYALGRRTYAVDDTATFITNHLTALNTNTLDVMRQDIAWAEDKELLGDPCDAVCWLNLKAKICAELTKREYRCIVYPQNNPSCNECPMRGE